jgi:hypothetical protein
MPGLACLNGWEDWLLLVHGRKKVLNVCDRQLSQRQMNSIRNRCIAQKNARLTSTSGDVFPTWLPLCTCLMSNKRPTFLCCQLSVTMDSLFVDWNSGNRTESTWIHVTSKQDIERCSMSCLRARNFAETCVVKYYGCQRTYQQHGVALVFSLVLSLLNTRIYYENTFRKYPLFILIWELKLNSMAFSPQANYTDRATAACRRS